MKLKGIGSNMIELTTGDYTFLFSYETPVAYHKEGVGFYRTDEFFSKTTSRHINKWLHRATAAKVSQTHIEELLNTLTKGGSDNDQRREDD